MISFKLTTKYSIGRINNIHERWLRFTKQNTSSDFKILLKNAYKMSSRKKKKHKKKHRSPYDSGLLIFK